MNNTVDEILKTQKDKIKSLQLVVPQRINKAILKMETIIKPELNDTEVNKLNTLIKFLKNHLDSKAKEIETITLNERKLTTNLKNNYTTEDDLWILSNKIYLLNFFEDHYIDKQKEGAAPKIIQEELIDYISKIDLNDMISLYESELYNTMIKNDTYWNNLKLKMKNEIEKEKLLIEHNQLDINDILIDLKLKLQEDDQYLNMLEKRQSELKEQTKIQAGKEPVQYNSALKVKPQVVIEDMVCQICNDGDYAEDDLIVFCSVMLIVIYCSY